MLEQGLPNLDKNFSQFLLQQNGDLINIREDGEGGYVFFGYPHVNFTK
jgi:hypothetical protein